MEHKHKWKYELGNQTLAGYYCDCGRFKIIYKKSKKTYKYLQPKAMNDSKPDEGKEVDWNKVISKETIDELIKKYEEIINMTCVDDMDEVIKKNYQIVVKDLKGLRDL